MNGKLLALAGGIALWGMASVASAAEPVILADGQLDQVTAGVASVSASARGNLTVPATFTLDNVPNVSSSASITAGPITLFGNGPWQINLTANSST